ncbi:DUF3014 domain-containing protein [Ramlibacter sp.]|uniref:DUF3014 domain-containing protein n=1 Tax=Ramlibacter sp. TaxID=1917967 RepID=UPI002FC582F0
MAPSPPPEIRLDPEDRRPAPPRRRRLLPIVAGVLLGLGIIAGWLWWSRQSAPVVATAPPPAAPAPVVQEPAPAPATLHPVRAPEEAGALQEQDLPAELAHLFGPQSSEFLVLEDFPRRFVATLDNLGRAHAPPSAWPVQPMGGRFTVEERADGSQVIAAANAQRYARFVAFATAVDTESAVRLYTRMYPVLEGAWRQLGMGDRYLNDRVVAVIDQLLATPEPAGPPQVRLTEVKGPIPSTRPWVRYEFVDPQLESLSAGQKVLIRVGPEHAKRLKQKLVALRQHLARR